MRSEEEVRAKFESLYGRRLVQRREEFLSCTYRNCLYNVRLRVKGSGKVGFCRNPDVVGKTEGQPFVCDEEGTAKRCRCFDCRNTPESVRQDFEEILRSPARCGNKYPKLAIMIWFLQDTGKRTRRQRLWTAMCDVASSVVSLLAARWW